MKSNSKKMAAEITSALTDATLAKSSRKKIMKKIDATANKLVKRINKRIDAATLKNQKSAIKKEQKDTKKVAKKLSKNNTAEVTT